MSSVKCTGVDIGHEPRPCGPQEAFLSLWLWPFVYASQTLSLSLISAMMRQDATGWHCKLGNI